MWCGFEVMYMGYFQLGEALLICTSWGPELWGDHLRLVPGEWQNIPQVLGFQINV
jgi:hypothetical protein